MDPRLLRYYEQELQYLREMGQEFAEEFPKIARRLGLEQQECPDPYVERLLEGVSFLAARVHLKLDAEFPRFTQHLMEIVYPDYLAPVPSMTVVQFHPNLSDGGLANGFPLPRGTVLKSILGKDDQTSCEYRTSQATTLWPLEVVHADYMIRDTASFEMPKLAGVAGISGANTVKAALQLRLRTTAGLKINQLSLDRLIVYLKGDDQLPVRIYEQLLANTVAVVVRPVQRPAPWQEVLKPTSICRVGFEDKQGLLPSTPRSCQGYRLLQEYFACPQRYQFFELTDLLRGVRRCSESEIELVFLFNRRDAALEGNVDPSQFVLGCSPAINLFPRRADRIHLSDQSADYHLIPDRTRPMDFEVHSVTSLRGYGSAAEEEQDFLPFYGYNGQAHQGAFYTLHRLPRQLSSRQRRNGPRSTYVGNEVFLSLVDGQEGPFRHRLRQLAPEILCTNRDLPLQMPLGVGKTDFTLDASAPVKSVRSLITPTKPGQPLVFQNGEVCWRLISHLSLNYLSIVGDDQLKGVEALREMLTLYADSSLPEIRKQIEGLVGVSSQPVIRRLPLAGPITCGRGIEVSITFDEAAFAGAGVFILGAVLDEFFAKYVSINAFTETVIKTVERGEVARWPARIGRRTVL
jgi:type VI secretion system protein ImpG